MKPLIVLLTSFVISLLTLYFIRGQYEPALSGRIAMSVMLVFTALAHFVYTKGMTMMIPDFVPVKKQVVYLSGIIEMIAAIGLLIPVFRHGTALLLILFFIILLPANIFAAIKHIDYQKGSSDGAGVNYLWFRIPLQILFILWTYFSTINISPWIMGYSGAK
jgi:uncharacterized membrane protein